MKLKKHYETADLLLTLSHRSLARATVAYYEKNRDFLAPFEPQRDHLFFTYGYQYRLLLGDEAARQEDTGYRFWLSRKEEPHVLIGSIALSNIQRGTFQSCYLSYKLDQDLTGRGYMTQAVEKVTEIAFSLLKLHRIEANVMPRNRPSRRVLEKAGYVEEGLAKDYLKINGVWEDHIHLVKLNPEG